LPPRWSFHSFLGPFLFKFFLLTDHSPPIRGLFIRFLQFPLVSQQLRSQPPTRIRPPRGKFPISFPFFQPEWCSSFDLGSRLFISPPAPPPVQVSTGITSWFLKQRPFSPFLFFPPRVQRMILFSSCFRRDPVLVRAPRGVSPSTRITLHLQTSQRNNVRMSNCTFRVPFSS